jgi:acyl-CoA synthetase (NDP forming)
VFNYAVSAGQEIATTMADYIEFLLRQPETRVIGCLMETVRSPDRFIAAIEKADRQGIPVVALKLGRSERGRHFALAHSGALAGSDAAYGAIFARHNVIRVNTPDEFTDMLELLRSPRRPGSGGVGIVTDSGGERELIVDLATEIGVELAEVGPATKERLVSILDPGMEPQNPVDSYGDGRTLMEDCLHALADDPGVAVVALATNLVHGRPYARSSSTAIEHVFAATDKPALVFGNLHSSVSRDEATRLRSLGVPVLMGTETALKAIRGLISWQRHRENLCAEIPIAPAPDVVESARALAKAPGAERALAPPEALRILEIFEIPVAQSAFVATVEDAVAAASRMGYPVVLKTAAPEILHKTEVGGVAVGLGDRYAVTEAYGRIARACGPAIQVQAQAAPGVEMLLGMTNDPQFGPMVTVGIGGIFTELLADTVTFQPPVGARMARVHLERLRGYKLLRGYRGRPEVDIDGLTTVIERFSLLCSMVGPLFSAIDLNPVIAGPSCALSVDALFLPLRSP